MNAHQRRIARRLPKQLEHKKRAKMEGRKRNNPVNKFIKGIVNKLSQNKE